MVREMKINQLAFSRYSKLTFPLCEGPSSPYGRLTEIVVAERGPWQAVVITCKTCLLQSMIRTTYPDSMWSSGCCGSRPDVMFVSVVCLSLRSPDRRSAPRVLLGNPDEVIRMRMCATRHQEIPRVFCGDFCVCGDCIAVSTLFFQFYTCFISVQARKCLQQGSASSGPSEVVSTEKAEGRASPSQRSNSMRAPFPLRAVQGIPSFTQIPPAFIHPIQSGMAAICLLQLVTELPDSTKGGRRVCGGRGAGRALEHPEGLFSKLLIGASGFGQEGHVVEWVEKASFVRLNKLFEILPREEYEAAKEGSAWGALHSERPPFYKEVQQADAEKRRASLTIGRGKKEGPCGRLRGKTVRVLSSCWRSSKEEKKTSNKGKEVKLPTPPKEL
ncbi:hypothetical protein CK203_006402 [Vitis vinifera]|uniref:Uncharacterized protein n=1 Tax=Vitis vinifera TaxID=29760 RepID=A0A438KB43_VITVI|nr:hypothetical protein CK203_006402 [Vitis vinifera]